MSSEQYKINSQRIFEDIWNAGNLAITQDLFAPHYVLHVPLGTFQGVEGFKQYVTGMRSAFPDIHFTIDDQLAEGDKSVVRWTARGTHQGAFQDIPPTGKQASVTAITIFRWANGMAEEAWTVYDQMSLLQQLGLMPAREQTNL